MDTRIEFRDNMQKKNQEYKPFLKWAGGKNWFIKYLPQLIGDLKFRQYYEPFFGGGSVFFAINPEKACLSDVNEDLITAYEGVRDYVEEVIETLEAWDVSEETYYKIRSYRPRKKSRKAARFIYLNRTSYNGLWRVNRKGEYNVPYGKRDGYEFDVERIRLASVALQGKTLKQCSFEEALADVEQDDLVFLDPPYTVAHNNNGFINYNKQLFSIDDQRTLKSCIQNISEKGAYFILTNAAHNAIHEIFHDCGHEIEVTRFSSLGGRRAKRQAIKELVFTNITIGEKDELD